jgi:hypothetical protein
MVLNLKDILNGPHEYVNGTYRPLPPPPKPEEVKKVEPSKPVEKPKYKE